MGPARGGQVRGGSRPQRKRPSRGEVSRPGWGAPSRGTQPPPGGSRVARPRGGSAKGGVRGGWSKGKGGWAGEGAGGTPASLGLPTRAGCLTRGCRGSQMGSESQSHVLRGTSTSPRKMLRPRLSRCHTDRLSTRPRSSACGTEYWGQEVRFKGPLRQCGRGWGGGAVLPCSLHDGIWGSPERP